MFVDFSLAGCQVLLVFLKLTERFERSWWLVFLPSLIWLGLNIVLSLAKHGESEQDDE